MLPPPLGVLLVAAGCCLQGAAALRLVAANIPVYRQVGESTTLLCDYDLEGHGLYSFKWYKDNIEFYRYMPGTLPAKLVYPDLPGINVDLPSSDEISVRLTMLDMDSTGTYRCEVSAEGPKFPTVNSAATMVVVVLPEGDPIISGQDEVYSPRQSIDLNCTSERSKPAAQLMWLINGKRVSRDYLVPHRALVQPDGLETSTLGLHIPGHPPAFRSGRMELTCVSYIKAFNYASSTTDVIASYGESLDNLVSERRSSLLVRSKAVSLRGSVLATLLFLITSCTTAV